MRRVFLFSTPLACLAAPTQPRDEAARELRAELQRSLACLKGKRQKISNLQEELRHSQGRLDKLQAQLEQAQVTTPTTATVRTSLGCVAVCLCPCDAVSLCPCVAVSLCHCVSVPVTRPGLTGSGCLCRTGQRSRLREASGLNSSPEGRLETAGRTTKSPRTCTGEGPAEERSSIVTDLLPMDL